MLAVTYKYRIDPDASQQAARVSGTEALLLAWLEIGRDVYNYTLPEINEWIASCSWPVDRGSWVQESILSADAPFPVD
ncbi:hypothetical protein [Synechococcus sp. R55.2]|uniref:hypothetical protein n=1 Tax=Synechococcus sp. R55.2 TaxID=2964496 RepID=UPI0039C2D5F0